MEMSASEGAKGGGGLSRGGRSASAETIDSNGGRVDLGGEPPPLRTVDDGIEE